MITTIILITFLAVCILLLTTDEFGTLYPIGLIGIIITSFFLIMHLVCLSQVSYEYNSLKVNRDSFQRSLNEARKNGNEYESAAILEKIVDFNYELSQKKYDNKTIFLDQYVDDRVELLNTIK